MGYLSQMAQRKWWKLCAGMTFFCSLTSILLQPRITNYLFQDDEEKFWWFISNGIQFSVVFFRFHSPCLSLSHSPAHTHTLCHSIFLCTLKLSINIWVQEAVADFDSERRTHLLARKNYVLEKFRQRKIFEQRSQRSTSLHGTAKHKRMVLQNKRVCFFFILSSSSCVFKCNESARVRDKHTWMLLFQLLSLIKFFCVFFFLVAIVRHHQRRNFVIGFSTL